MKVIKMILIYALEKGNYIHKEKIKHKSSSKTCKNYLDLKLVRSNFYNSFSP